LLLVLFRGTGDWLGLGDCGRGANEARRRHKARFFDLHGYVSLFDIFFRSGLTGGVPRPHDDMQTFCKLPKSVAIAKFTKRRNDNPQASRTFDKLSHQPEHKPSEKQQA
jgi:hypothetical protein